MLSVYIRVRMPCRSEYSTPHPHHHHLITTIITLSSHVTWSCCRKRAGTVRKTASKQLQRHRWGWSFQFHFCFEAELQLPFNHFILRHHHSRVLYTLISFLEPYSPEIIPRKEISRKFYRFRQLSTISAAIAPNLMNIAATNNIFNSIPTHFATLNVSAE